RAQRDSVTGLAERHLDAGDRREDLELAQRSEMTDAEHFAAQPAEPDTEREVKPIARPRDQGVRIKTLGHHDGGQAVRVGLGLFTQDRQAPRAYRGADALSQPPMPREDVAQALAEQDVERLTQAEEQQRRRRVRKEAGGVVLEDGSPIEEVPRAAASGRDLHRSR